MEEAAGARQSAFPDTPKMRAEQMLPKHLGFLLSAAAIVLVLTVLQTPLCGAVAPPQTNNSEAPLRAAHSQAVTEYSLQPDQLAKARALYHITTVLYVAGSLWGILLLWVFLETHIGPVLRNFAERCSNRRFIQTSIFVPLLMLLIAVILLPLEAYGHHISLAYGLSVQGWIPWLGDRAKAEAIFILISVIAVATLFWIIGRSRQRWWFYFWLLTLPFILLIVFIAPIIVDPMFNTFAPLGQTHPELVSAIQEIAVRGGLNIPTDRIFEMKASEKVTTYNAYVTGIGATKRVVVWDNTVQDMTTPEILFVFGHEMGHYVLNHIYKGLAFFAAMSFLGFWAGKRITEVLLSRLGAKWRIRGIDDLASLPAFVLVLAILMLISEPVGNAFSRHLEHQADIYALEVTHGVFSNNRQVAASSFQKLGEKSYDYPAPNRFLVMWAYDHPTIQQRIRFALQYDPWHTAAGPKYVK